MRLKLSFEQQNTCVSFQVLGICCEAMVVVSSALVHHLTLFLFYFFLFFVFLFCPSASTRLLENIDYFVCQYPVFLFSSHQSHSCLIVSYNTNLNLQNLNANFRLNLYMIIVEKMCAVSCLFRDSHG